MGKNIKTIILFLKTVYLIQEKYHSCDSLSISIICTAEIACYNEVQRYFQISFSVFRVTVWRFLLESYTLMFVSIVGAFIVVSTNVVENVCYFIISNTFCTKYLPM